MGVSIRAFKHVSAVPIRLPLASSRRIARSLRPRGFHQRCDTFPGISRLRCVRASHLLTCVCTG